MHNIGIRILRPQISEDIQNAIRARSKTEQAGIIVEAKRLKWALLLQGDHAKGYKIAKSSCEFAQQSQTEILKLIENKNGQ